jgi:putative transposase
VGIEKEICHPKPTNEGIGIDVGIKELAICSNGKRYANINKTAKVRKLKKRQRRLQRKISRKYEMNKEGGRYRKTSNIIKSEKKLRKLNHRLTGLRHNHIHQVTSEITKRKPSYIVIEDLNIRGMMRSAQINLRIIDTCRKQSKSSVCMNFRARWSTSATGQESNM